MAGVMSAPPPEVEDEPVEVDGEAVIDEPEA